MGLESTPLAPVEPPERVLHERTSVPIPGGRKPRPALNACGVERPPDEGIIPHVVVKPLPPLRTSGEVLDHGTDLLPAQAHKRRRWRGPPVCRGTAGLAGIVAGYTRCLHAARVIRPCRGVDSTMAVHAARMAIDRVERVLEVGLLLEGSCGGRVCGERQRQNDGGSTE